MGTYFKLFVPYFLSELSTIFKISLFWALTQQVYLKKNRDTMGGFARKHGLDYEAYHIVWVVFLCPHFEDYSTKA